jgi:exodeoxyribonuclease VII small subunit
MVIGVVMAQKDEKTKDLSLNELLAMDDVDKGLKEVGFEQGIKLLEELVTKVESGALPLDKAVLSYEKGVGLIQKLRGLLAGAEEKLRELKRAE